MGCVLRAATFPGVGVAALAKVAADAGRVVVFGPAEAVGRSEGLNDCRQVSP